MKTLRIILSLMACVIASATALAQRTYFLELRDGSIQAFRTNMVDSLTVSYFDLDSIEHMEYVTQEVWTLDTVYRFPLDDILRLTFDTPPVIYQPGVINLDEEIYKYVTKVDDLTFYLRKDIPARLIPKSGEKVSSIDNEDVFPYLFAAEVNKVENEGDDIRVECCLTDITEIYERLYYTGEVEAEAAAETEPLNRASNDNSQQSTTWEAVYRYHPESPFNIDFRGWYDIYDLAADVTKGFWSIGASIARRDEVHNTVNPDISIGCYYVIDGPLRTKFGLWLDGTVDINSKFTFENKFSANGKIHLIPQDSEMALSYGPINLKIPTIKKPKGKGKRIKIDADIYLGIAGEAEIVSEYNMYNRFKIGGRLQWGITGIVDFRNSRFNIAHETFKQDLSATYYTGNIQLYSAFEFAAKFPHSLVPVTTIEARFTPVDLTGTMKLLRETATTDSPTRSYDLAKEQELNNDWSWSISPGLKLELDSLGLSTTFTPTTWGDKTTVWHTGVVPLFTNVDAGRDINNPEHVLARFDIERESLIPWCLGVIAIDEKGERISKFNFKDSDEQTSFDLDNIDKSRKWTIYPALKMGNVELACSPGKEINPVEDSPEISCVTFSFGGGIPYRHIWFLYKGIPSDNFVEDSCQWGTVIYKDDVEFKSSIGDESCLLDLRDEDFSIDNAHYTATGNKAKWELALYKKTLDEKGDTIISYTQRTRFLPVYDQKPTLTMYRIYDVSDEIWEDDIMIVSLREDHWFKGAFWTDDIVNSTADLRDFRSDVIYPVYGENSLGWGLSSRYYQGSRPKTFSIGVKDITTGKVLKVSAPIPPAGGKWEGPATVQP